MTENPVKKAIEEVVECGAVVVAAWRALQEVRSDVAEFTLAGAVETLASALRDLEAALQDDPNYRSKFDDPSEPQLRVETEDK